MAPAAATGAPDVCLEPRYFFVLFFFVFDFTNIYYL